MKPENELQRLEALRSYEVLNSEPEVHFDRLTSLAARLFGVPIALVSLVDDDRQWFKSCLGLEVSETGRDVAFCAHTILQDKPMVVPDAAEDPRFWSNPLVTGAPWIRFYAGAPLLTSDGLALGTLCVIDRVPRAFDAGQLQTLTDLAAIVVDELNLRQAKRQLEQRSRELNQALEEAQRQRHLFEKIAHTCPDVIYVLDLATRTNLYVNRDAITHLGYTAEQVSELGNRLLPTILHPEDLPRVAQHFDDFATLADGEHIEISYRARQADGDYRWFLARENIFRRNHDGSPSEILGVASDVTELKVAEERLAQLAVVDDLTGAPNKRAFRQCLNQLVVEAQRGRSFALVMADIDHFKQLNDTWGHPEGDCVLSAVATALRASIRNRDLVARYGGEEFAILLVDVDEAHAIALAERLRVAVEKVRAPRAISASFGVCTFAAAPDTTGDAIVRAADEALYRAKHAGRNCVVAYSRKEPTILATFHPRVPTLAPTPTWAEDVEREAGNLGGAGSPLS